MLVTSPSVPGAPDTPDRLGAAPPRVVVYGDTGAPDGGAARPPRVVLYGRAECHLCDDARSVVSTVCAEEGEAWVEVDIDAAAERSDPSLVERYGDYVPVVTVDGVQQGFWQVDAARLSRALRRGTVRGSAAKLG